LLTELLFLRCYQKIFSYKLGHILDSRLFLIPYPDIIFVGWSNGKLAKCQVVKMSCLDGFTHHKVDTGRKQKGGNEGNATTPRA
jgi:hypothetical protein